MTQRLPVPGQDDGTWGDILNGFLEVSLNSDGTLQAAALTQAGGEVQSNKGVASGYASLNGSGLVPATQLGSGTASSSNYLRGDGTWVTPNSGSSTLASDTDVTISSPTNNQVLTYDTTASKWVNQSITESQVANLTTDLAATEKTANKGAASGYAPLNGSSQVPIANIPTGTTSTTVAIGNDSRFAGSAAGTAGASLSATDSTTTNSRTPTGTASGDLSGTYPGPTVAKIQGTTVSAPSGGTTSFLNANGTWTTPAGTASNASYSTPGLVQLAGDLGSGTSGTATSPQVTATHLASALPLNQGGTGSISQNFVDLSTNQTIAGTKTFSSTITGSVSGNAATVTTNANLTGDVTSVGNATTLTSSTNVESIISSNTTVTGAIQKSVVAAKGDLIIATAASTVTNYSAGNNGQVPMYDSTQTAGFRSVDLDNVAAWSMSGTLTLKTGAIRYYVEYPYTITNVRAAVGTAPTGTSIILDVLKNGATIYTTTSNRPTIAISTNTTTANNPDITNLSAGDYLTVSVIQVGSTVIGADLSVTVTMRHA